MKNYFRYLLFLLFILIVFLGLFFLINLADNLFVLKMTMIDKISITSTFIFGLSVAFFSYLQDRRNVLSEEPKIFFDISFDAILGLTVGLSKYVVSQPTNNTNIFVVIKNVGVNAIYNVEIRLIGDIDNLNPNHNRIVYLPALLPGDTKLFNTFITTEGINMFGKAKVVVNFSNSEFVKQKSITYDLIKNKDYIVNYLKTFTQSGDTMASEFYRKVSSIRKNEDLNKFNN